MKKNFIITNILFIIQLTNKYTKEVFVAIPIYNSRALTASKLPFPAIISLRIFS